MKKEQATRRQFIKKSVNSAAGAAVLSALAPQNLKTWATPPEPASSARIVYEREHYG